MQLEFSRAADEDFDAILTYSTLHFGEAVADEYLFSFNAVFEMLLRHPEIGTSMQHVRPRARKLTHRRHRIFYEINGDTVRLLRILHHAKDVMEALRL